VTTTPELPPKKDVMLALLERSSVFIHLDPRREDVRVPAWFKKQPQLVLQVGLNMAVRIPDLEVGDDAVSCTLSFSRSPFFCYMPWSAVFALVAEDGKGMLWPNDIPKEVAAQQADRAQKDQAREHVRAVPQAGPEKEAPPMAEKSDKSDKAAKADKPAGKAPGKKRGQARVRAEKAPESPEAKPAAAEPARPSPAAAASKRPLPPYLRVVK
jgi:stringent starvation protein B